MKKKPPVKAKEVKQDLLKKITYQGEVRSIVGMHRLLVRSKGKESFIFVYEKSVPIIQEKYGSDFIRNCGVVKQDHKPTV